MDSDLFSSDDSDDELVRQFQCGDLRAFDKLYLRYNQQIYQQIKGMVGQQDAEDVFQEIWWIVYQQLFTLKIQCSFKAWLKIIVKNKCIDHLRRKKKKNEQPLPLELDGNALVVYDRDPSPEEQFIAREQLREVFQRLKPRHRDILLLTAQGYTDEEIARRLGVKVRCVPTLRSQAREKLRRLLHREKRRRKRPG